MACDTIKIETLDADEVVSIVTAGPQGPSGSEAATLTTTGDLLYRAALANDRLPIGSEGQVLKVASGLPVWGNESGAVTSVNGETGAVTLDSADVGATAALETRQHIFYDTSIYTLAQGRNVQLNVAVSQVGATGTITLPRLTTDLAQNGDDIFIVLGGTMDGGQTLVIEKYIWTGSGYIESTQAVVTTTTTGAWRFRLLGGQWQLQPVNTHTHIASDITSGTLAHERGGLEADVSSYNGLLKISSGSTSAVTVTAAGEALLDDATNADQRTTLGLGTAAVANLGTGASDAAYGNHTHAQLHDKSHTMTDATSHSAGNWKLFYSDGAGAVQELALASTAGHVLQSNGATSAPSFAAASGGVSAVGASTADVLSVSGSDLVADDGGTIDSADPFIKWDDTAGKLVYANPLSRPSGAFYVGLAPTTTALGTNSIDIQTARTNANQVASGAGSIAIGIGVRADGADSLVIGSSIARASSAFGVAIGYQSFAGANDTVAIGTLAAARAINGVSIGRQVDENLRSIFATRPFNAVYWGGQTTNNTATILNLDATATNRFTIAANTALAVDILLVARRSDTADKWLVARRFLGIRRDGSNNTSLIGSVQTLGTDQSDGSPTWSFTLTADDTNEALQLEVTGAASETVQWRATAFYRVV